MEFKYDANQSPASESRRAEILANPGFGQYFSDHMVTIDWTADLEGQEAAFQAGDYLKMVGEWHDARVEPYAPLSLSPAAAVLHYAQEIFEGLKAYRHADGSIWTFRPYANAGRMNRSAHRMAMPQLPEETFVKALAELMERDSAWVPDGEGQSLYLRPFMIATEEFLGVRPARNFSFHVIASPAGNYFGAEPKPVSIWVSREFARAGEGGTGAAKFGGNYAASLAGQLQGASRGHDQVIFLDRSPDESLEELGGMNVFFVTKDKTLVTPRLTGTILEGITRDSILQLGTEQGLKVEERRITFNEWKDGVASGQIQEVFACGTAAVITPIGQVADRDEVHVTPSEDFPVAQALRDRLIGIQTGVEKDPHGWMHRLA
jgi:branched-chain amino acid aminotransferase